IRQRVVDALVRLRELDKELATKLLDSRILVNDGQGQQSTIILNLDHSIEDQVTQHHDGSLANVRGWVPQALVDTVAPGLNQVGESIRQITQCNHNVAPNRLILLSLQNSEQELQVGAAKAQTDR